MRGTPSDAGVAPTGHLGGARRGPARDHLEAIAERVGASSRGEMVTRPFADRHHASPGRAIGDVRTADARRAGPADRGPPE